ncbi:chromatin assembly factor 1 subunit FAS1-like [Pistacia vera]|uniref:chromatin assembly factor 1 subunit FAS1-like n=1 Tax=Pistacia vera TaxID=55513 RepID=UPI001262E848|nr:chromatin assembly factor 1 subunit FAS1-like [Pistacia vera]
MQWFVKQIGGGIDGGEFITVVELVEEIHMKVKENENVGLTLAAVKSAVVCVGHRVMYGFPNVDADVLEDHTQACLWCWETRDVKLLPNSVRGALKIRRMCRRKIHERITAVSGKFFWIRWKHGDIFF